MKKDQKYLELCERATKKLEEAKKLMEEVPEIMCERLHYLSEPEIALDVSVMGKFKVAFAQVCMVHEIFAANLKVENSFVTGDVTEIIEMLHILSGRKQEAEKRPDRGRDILEAIMKAAKDI